MKVKELKKLLENVNDERIVVMSKDGEGNGFSPLYFLDDESRYLADSTWSGEVGLEKLTPKLQNQGYGDEDVLEDGELALVLWPVN